MNTEKLASKDYVYIVSMLNSFQKKTFSQTPFHPECFIMIPPRLFNDMHYVLDVKAEYKLRKNCSPNSASVKLPIHTEPLTFHVSAFNTLNFFHL